MGQERQEDFWTRMPGIGNEMETSKPQAEGQRSSAWLGSGALGVPGRGGPGERVEAGGLTELERWATALMCSSSSKMRSSSSSVR